MRKRRLQYWRYLSKRNGRLWFVRRPTLWWSPTARTEFAMQGWIEALNMAIQELAAMTLTPAHFYSYDKTTKESL